MLSTTILKLPRIKTLGIKQEERLDRTVQKVRDNPSPDSCFQTVPRMLQATRYNVSIQIKGNNVISHICKQTIKRSIDNNTRQNRTDEGKDLSKLQ